MSMSKLVIFITLKQGIASVEELLGRRLAAPFTLLGGSGLTLLTAIVPHYVSGHATLTLSENLFVPNWPILNIYHPFSTKN